MDLLRLRAGSAPDKGIWFVESDREESWLPYSGLLLQAERILAGLGELGLRAGDKVPLVFRRPSEFLPVFWGCVLGGILPVPLAPPMRVEDSDEIRKLSAIWQALGRPRLLVESSFSAAMDRLLDPSGATQVAVGFDELPQGDGKPALHRPAPGDAAFVQYSSGSTKMPRGVVLSHANLISNVAQIAGRIPLGPEDVELGWMPHFHDMGLIGCHLTPLYRDGVQVRLETTVFLREPERWLTLATAKRATILTATNTALRLVLRRIRDVGNRDWDLKSVHAMLIGAEPISPRVLREVARLLEPAGLSASSLRVCYGLAEACVAVSFPGPEPQARTWRLSQSALGERRVVELPPERDDDVVEVAETGWPVDGLDLRIVDDTDCPVADRVVGHIQFRGPNASSGYLHDESATAAARCGAWWRTGDLGFTSGGRLVVCGRIKEILFFGGRNFFAQDLESAATAEPGIRTAVACAAPSRDGTHELALLFVVTDSARWQDDPGVLERVRRRVLRSMHVPLDAIIPIPKEDIPRTSSGKLRRFRLAEQFAQGRYDAVLTETGEAALERPAQEPTVAPEAPDHGLSLVLRTWADVLQVRLGAILPSDRFDELGGTSVAAQEILSRLEESTGLRLGQEMLSACPTAQDMAEWLRHPPLDRGESPKRTVRRQAGREIAIVGMACRLPGASTPDQFWENLAAGVDSVGGIPEGRWAGSGSREIRCRSGAFLDDPYSFDPDWFGLGDDEATDMDPQQRLLLAVGAECLQSAGYGGARGRRLRTGVFVGASQLPHQELLTASWQRADAFESLEATEAFASLPEEAKARWRETFAALAPARAVHPGALVGNLLNMLAARLSHELDLDGPAMAIDTACSASLVAVHEACESLLRGESDLALAGGVSLSLSPTLYRFFEAAGALSPTGRSRPFSAEGDGFVPGEGGAMVLLRPLSDAVAAGDRILAVIKGSAVNNDGRSIGVMAPNPAGQLAVLNAAYACAGVDPGAVDLVECHGTGTRIGDPIELRTVAEFFGGQGARRIRIGSVKSNLGHLLGAAGIAGLLKVVLSLGRGAVPPSLHADPPHPRLVERPVLHVPASLERWETPPGKPRVAGVNSFGFGGTNCHIVVESWPPPPALDQPVIPAPSVLLTLGAPTEPHAQAWAKRLASDTHAWESDREAAADELLDRSGQGAFRAFRIVGAGEPVSSALLHTSDMAGSGWHRGRSQGPRKAPRTAWLFPGQGSQFVHAAAGLFEHWGEFRRRLLELAGPVKLDRPLLDFCYAADATDESLRRTDVAQPLLVAFQIAMVDALRGLGLEPAAVVGHSVGEFAAAYAAGALEAETAVSWAAARGRMMQELPGDGAMLAVFGAFSRVARRVESHAPQVVVAAYNGPSQTILAGARDAVDALEAELVRAEVPVVRVAVRHAFHSPLVAPAAERFAAWLGDARSRPLRVPFSSTVSGSLLRGETLPASYWAEQVRKPVQFEKAMLALGQAGVDSWLELGPGSTLAGLSERIVDPSQAKKVHSLCRKPAPRDEPADWTHALTTLGELWLGGAALTHHPVSGHRERRRVTLPPQPFLERTLRLEQPSTPLGSAKRRSSLRQRTWQSAPVTPPAALPPGLWCVVADSPSVGLQLAGELRLRGSRAVLALASDSFRRVGDDDFALDPTRQDHLRWLVDSFRGEAIAGIIMLGATLALPPEEADPQHATASLSSAMLSIASAATVLESAAPGAVFAVTAANAWKTPFDRLDVNPFAAALCTFAAAVGEEHPSLRASILDIEPGSEAQEVGIATGVVSELARGAEHRVVVLRGERRLIPGWQDASEGTGETRPLPAGGVYLVFGGSSELAAELVEAVVDNAQGAVTIILAGRRAEASLPRPIVQMARAGAVVSYRVVDVTDSAAVKALIDETLARHGRLDGVVHAAGAVVFGSSKKRSPADLMAELAPKVIGSLHLARALRDRNVGFVALQSSVSASYPPLSKGLSGYAAANAFLDALACRLRTPERRWVSIGWAPWRNLGMARALDEAAGDPLAKRISPQEGRVAFLEALSAGLAHVVVAPPGTSERPSAQAPRIEPPARMAEEPVESGPPAAGAATTPSPAEEDLEAQVRALLASALRIEPGQLDPDTPFQSLGLSSLSAVDLLKELETVTGRKLSATLLFEHNTLARIVAHLQETRAQPAPQPLPAVAPARRFPLLPAQQTFYANQAFQPELPGYVFLRLELEGPVSAERLDEALRVLAGRHPMLRVVFDWDADELVQREGEFATPGVERVSLEGLPASDVAGRLDQLESRVRNEVFELAKGPLYRVVLCRIDEEHCCLLFNVHHIVADAWSAQILVTELLALHAELQSGSGRGLPALESSFEQGVDAVLALARSEDAEKSKDYWREVLQDAPTLPLPFDGDPLAMPSGPCHLVQLELDEGATSGLQSLARAWAVSPFHVLFTSYLLCLQRWSGRSDIVVRVANARREARVPGIQRVVGCFADSLPIRVRLREGEDAKQLASRVSDATAQAQAHHTTSSLQLAGIRGRPAQASPRGVTPAGLSFPDFQAPEQFGQVRVTGMRGGSASAFSQLGLIAWQFRGRLHLSWNFLQSLFRPETIRRLAQEHLEVLRGMTVVPGETDASRWTGPAGGTFREAHGEAPASRLPHGAVVHERIWERAEGSPERTALVFEGQSLTYAHLRKASLALAEKLLADGIGPGALVGILARPGVEAVVGLLGILSSGAAYVPLSPDYPDVRIAQIARHAQLTHLVTTRDQLARVAAWGDTALRQVLVIEGTACELDASLSNPAAPGQQGAHRPATANDLAYVMYTSGTTGDPKGVMVTHGAVSLFHDWVHEAFAVVPEDRFIQTSSLSFGGSIRQVYSPLLAGAAVYPAPQGLTRDPFALVGFLEQHAITIWNSVPTLWMRLLDCVLQLDAEGRRTDLDRLRWILIGGEHVPAAHVRRWIDRFGMRHRIANLYGSTETVVNAAWYRVQERPADDALHTPIGVARGGSEVHLLDSSGRPVVGSEVGELHVGGPSLSSGYLHAPEATAASFVSVSGVEGLVYRTGDLARRDERGNLVYLGRRDTQVKIRGNRVELGEIEGVLGLHEAVRAAAVVEYSTDERQWLVGFVSPAKEGRPPDGMELRRHVASRLPEFMVPHRIEVMASLPLTAAGKFDRRALLESLGASPPELEPDAPSGATESALARAWSAVLKLPSVGRHDDFFDLGGDSILALQVLQRLRRELPVVPRPMTLYAERTVARLARAIDAMRVSPPKVGEAPGGLVREPASAAEPDAWYELSPSQESFVLAQRVNPERSPIWSARIPIRGRFDRDALQRAADLAVARHPMLRTVIATQGLVTLQRALPFEPAPLLVEDLRPLPAPERERARAERYLADRTSVFALDRWPLWRMRALQHGDDAWELILTVHHAIGDGWSVHVLGSELLRDYDALLDGRPAATDSPRARFEEVVRHLRAASQERLRESERAWAERFARPHPAATVLAEGANSAVEATGSTPVGTGLPASQLDALRFAAKTARMPLHSVLLAMWFRALRRATSCSDLVVGVATSGRDLAVDDVERVFGCFATGLPIRAQIGAGAFETDLRTVHSAFEDASRHADLPIDRLLRAIPRHAGSPHPPGRSFFFSLMDFRALPAIESAHLSIGWSEADYHFEAAATGTELMLGVLARDELRLNVHGAAPEAIRRKALAFLVDEIRLFGEPHAVENGVTSRAPAPSHEATVVDSAIVAYLPAPEAIFGPGFPSAAADAREALRALLLPGGVPALVETLTTRFGVSGTVLIPSFADELPGRDGDTITSEVLRAMGVAAAHGARVVSLAGMLPSWTDYGLRLLDKGSPPAPHRMPRLTTGHAATSVAVATTVLSALRALGRDLRDLALGVVGFGSIGQTALHLLLDAGKVPRSIAIGELEGRLDQLSVPLAELRRRFSGTVCAVAAEQGLREELLACDVLIAATSEGNAIDVSGLRPGTVVVDDSFPPAIDSRAAVQRMRSDGDILVVRGGQLDLGDSSRTVLAGVAAEAVEEALRRIGLEGVPGCRAEAILAATEAGLPHILGLVGRDEARAWWDACERLGVGPSRLHCGPFPIEQDWIGRLKRRWDRRPIRG